MFVILSKAKDLGNIINTAEIPLFVRNDNVNHATLQSPSLKLPQQERTPVSPQEFLHQVAMSVIKGRPLSLDEAGQKPITVPLPLHARNFLDALPKIANLDEAIKRLKPLLSKPAVVSRARRFALLAGFMALPLFMLISLSIAIALVCNTIDRHPDIVALSTALDEFKTVKTKAHSGHTNLVAEQDALEIYIAGNFRSAITNSAILDSYGAMKIITPDKRQILEKIIARRGVPSEKEFSQAEAIVTKQMGLSLPKTEKMPIEVREGLKMAAPTVFECKRGKHENILVRIVNSGIGRFTAGRSDKSMAGLLLKGV